MRIIAISDTHLQHDFDIPEGDVLVHAGDGTWVGDVPQVSRWAKWMGLYPHRYKIAIAGNHDWLFQRDNEQARRIMENQGIVYLQDEYIGIEGKIFYGSPWQPEFCNWAFNLPRHTMELHEIWSKIPANLDVLITHGPPQGILDQVPRDSRMAFDPVTGMYQSSKEWESVGDYDLAERVKMVRPKVHIFGHVHASYGFTRVGPTRFYNAAIVGEDYLASNQPHVIDL